ncbi:hypothetical protein ACC771_16175, partial [Rhizobium ruizarguesonis]
MATGKAGSIGLVMPTAPGHQSDVHFGEFLAGLGEEAFFQSVLSYFTEATGIDVKYSSSENYEQQIVIDTQAGS